MTKKILLGLAAAVVVVGGVAAMSAFEAHVINVTAKIENALVVDPQAITFGTVFPQEYAERDFTITLSESFMAEGQDRVKDVEYKIVQKPKCINEAGEYAPVDYATHQCPEGYREMPDLCRFLSKLPSSPETGDVGVPSYFIKAANECREPESHLAYGRLDKCLEPLVCGKGDIADCWIVDLKVPPVEGFVGQDWPASCAPWVVPTDGADYGCDLWIEVTGFSYFNET